MPGLHTRAGRIAIVLITWAVSLFFLIIPPLGSPELRVIAATLCTYLLLDMVLNTKVVREDVAVV
jgi:hypothetical protein